MINQLTGQSYDIAIQQKNLWKYLKGNELPLVSLWKIHILGKPDVGQLNAALNTCFADKEIFRQIYPQPEGLSFPVTQVLTGDMTISIENGDAIDAQERFRYASNQCRNVQPVVVFGLQITDDQYDLEIYMSALSFDKSAYRIFFSSFCNACSGQVEMPETELIQYIDFSEWQNEVFKDEAHEGLSFWNKALHSVSKAQFPYPLVQASATGRIATSRQLDSTKTAALKAFCAARNVRLHDFFLAVYVQLIKKICQVPEVLVGIKVDGRVSEEVKNVLGLLDQFIPVNILTDPDGEIASNLTDIRFAVETAAQWQCFFDKDKIAALSEFKAGYFPFIYDYEDIRSTYEVGGVVFKAQEEFEVFQQSDLLLHVLHDQGEDSIRLNFSFNGTEIAPYFAELFADELLNLSHSFLSVSRLKQLAFLPDSELQILLNHFNPSGKSFEHSNCALHQLFEQQVLAHPENKALNDGLRELTYAELNERANSVAAYLQKVEVKQGDIVALLTERSVETVIGLLGILKAGAAFMPLSASYPQERVSVMLEEARVRAVLAQQKLRHLVQQTSEYPIVTLDTAEVLHYAGELDPVNVQPTDIAYIIFTSGSTGRPKACQLMHANIVNYTQAINEVVFLNKGGYNFPLLSPISFDFTFTVLFGSILNGKTLYIFSEQDDILNSLQKCFNDELEVDAIKLTPSHILALDQLPCVSSKMKLVMSGGEALGFKHLEIIRKVAPQARIVNHYGPTEATVGCIVNEISPRDERICIGKPLPNVKAYIVDEEGALLPIGLTGEIAIAGAGVSPGYLNSAELNAQRFVLNEWLGERMYRTGDLGRYLPNGKIEYLGRKDNQVKIRGFRIEPQEIASAISSFAGIEKAVVLADKDQQESNILVAFYSTVDGEEVERAALTAFLQEQLPDYMIPSFWVKVNSFPVNHNGKLDTKKLLQLDYRNVGGGVKVQPQNPTQRLLAEIWQDILGLKEVGIRDNFFELGGHSLLAMQVISRVRFTFDKEIQLRALFSYPTIEGLQAHIDTEAELEQIPAFTKVDKGQPIPMSYAQKRLWFLYQLNPESTMYNMPVSMKLSGKVQPEALKASIDLLCRRHEILRTVFKSEDTDFLQVIQPEPFTDYFSIEDISDREAADKDRLVKALLVEENNYLFNLETGPLLRVKLVLTAGEESYLLINMHHIIMDEWSAGIFTAELSTVYNAFIRSEQPQLQQLDFSYADFAVWQSVFLAENEAKQKNFWKTKLAGINPFFELPFAKKRIQKETYTGAVLPFSLSENLSLQLRTLAQKQQVSMFMLLYSAYALLLHKYTGLKTLQIGTPVANRNYRELEGILGFFVNTLALKTNFEGHLDFNSYLNTVKEELMDAFSHQDIPFEKVVQELNMERRPGYTPVFQSFFVLHNQHKNHFTLDGLEIQEVSLNEREAKFDLVLSVDDTPCLNAYLEYNADVYEEEDMRRFCKHFEHLLSQIVHSPQAALHKFQLITEEEGEFFPAEAVFEHIDFNAGRKPQHASLLYNLDEFPLTSTEEIEGKALERYVTEQPVTEAPVESPLSGETEHKLAAIWTSLIPGVEVDAKSDFFALGGHSLLLIMLRSRVRETFGVDCSIKFFFEHTVLSGMAAHIEQLQDKPQQKGIGTEIKRVSRQQFKK